MARMHNPSHPGVILRGWMGELGLDIAQLAHHLNIDFGILSSLIQGQAGITAGLDLRISEALGTTPGYWWRMQISYDEWEAQEQAKMRPRLERLAGFYPWKPHIGDTEKLSTDPWVWVDLPWKDAMLCVVNAGLRLRPLSNPAHDPLCQFGAAHNCVKDRPLIEKGNGLVLLNAICRCLKHGLEIPEWLSNPLIQRVDRIVNMEAPDWSDDSVFGKAYPLNTKVESERKRRLQSIDVYLIVAEEIVKSQAKKDGFGLASKLVAGLHDADIRTLQGLYDYAINTLLLEDPEGGNYDDGHKLYASIKRAELEGYRSFFWDAQITMDLSQVEQVPDALKSVTFDGRLDGYVIR